MATIEYPIVIDAVPGNLRVEITLSRGLRVRLRIGIWLLRVAAWLIGADMTVSIVDAKDGDTKTEERPG